MSAGRIAPRPAFLQAERRPLLYFVTSNTDKLIQARLMFAKYGLQLQSFHRSPVYVEDYTQGKEKLLEVGVREVTRSLGSSALFFLEDTSARVEALSNEGYDVPGLAIKEWYSEARMEETVAEILANGLSREVSVRSDIALHIPGLDRPIFFHGTTRGLLAETPPTFSEDPRYPWLTPRTLNGWIIPDGAECRLGEMSLDASLEYDFRAAAIRSMIDRLEEYVSILNLPSQAYALRGKPIGGQAQLPLGHATCFLVIGDTCAGKTTFGERASIEHAMTHIEASNVMRMLPLPEETPTDISAFTRASMAMLHGGYDIVARKMVDVYGPDLERDCVITGLRTLQEVDLLQQLIPWAQIVLVDASEATRYTRYLERERADDELTLERFRARDSEHHFFGLLGVADHVADLRIRNEGSISDFFAQIDGVIAGRGTRLRGVAPPISTDVLVGSQMYRVLSGLSSAQGPLTPVQIEGVTAEIGQVGRSSARKVLGEIPALVRRSGTDSNGAFEISESGSSYLNIVRRRIS